MTVNVQSAVSHLAAMVRHRKSPQEVADARNALVAARLERAIEDALTPHEPGYEPLRPADRTRLARLLRP